MVGSEGILYALTPVSSAKNSIAQKATLGWSKSLQQELIARSPATREYFSSSAMMADTYL